MDTGKIAADMRLGDIPKSQLIMLALILHIAQYPAAMDGAVTISVNRWRGVEVCYRDMAAAEAAEGTFTGAGKLAEGSVLVMSAQPIVTCGLRGEADNALFAHAYDAAYAALAKHFPLGVTAVRVDENGLDIVRDAQTRLPAVWQRLGRVTVCAATRVRLTWLQAVRA